MSLNRIDQLGALLERLEHSRISFKIGRTRSDGISVLVTVPGQRWEVDFLSDGDIDVERFLTIGQVESETALDDLFAQFAEPLDSEPQSIESNGVVTH